MYTGGEGSSKEKKRNAKAAAAGNKKHTIKERQKAIGKASLRLVRDAMIAGAFAVKMALVGSLTMTGTVAVGLAGFAALKLVETGFKHGKKHYIKERAKNSTLGKVECTALNVAAASLPLLVYGVAPISIAASGIAAAALAVRAHKKKKERKIGG